MEKLRHILRARVPSPISSSMIGPEETKNILEELYRSQRAALDKQESKDKDLNIQNLTSLLNMLCSDVPPQKGKAWERFLRERSKKIEHDNKIQGLCDTLPGKDNAKAFWEDKPIAFVDRMLRLRGEFMKTFPDEIYAKRLMDLQTEMLNVQLQILYAEEVLYVFLTQLLGSCIAYTVKLTHVSEEHDRTGVCDISKEDGGIKVFHSCHKAKGPVRVVDVTLKMLLKQTTTKRNQEGKQQTKTSLYQLGRHQLLLLIDDLNGRYEIWDPVGTQEPYSVSCFEALQVWVKSMQEEKRDFITQDLKPYKRIRSARSVEECLLGVQFLAKTQTCYVFSMLYLMVRIMFGYTEEAEHILSAMRDQPSYYLYRAMNWLRDETMAIQLYSRVALHRAFEHALEKLDYAFSEEAPVHKAILTSMERTIREDLFTLDNRQLTELVVQLEPYIDLTDFVALNTTSSVVDSLANGSKLLKETFALQDAKAFSTEKMAQTFKDWLLTVSRRLPMRFTEDLFNWSSQINRTQTPHLQERVNFQPSSLAKFLNSYIIQNGLVYLDTMVRDNPLTQQLQDFLQLAQRASDSLRLSKS